MNRRNNQKFIVNKVRAYGHGRVVRAHDSFLAYADFSLVCSSRRAARREFARNNLGGFNFIAAEERQ